MLLWITFISELCCCLSLSSNEMFNVFDEANVDFGLPVMNLADDSSNNNTIDVNVTRYNTADYLHTTDGNRFKFIHTEKPVINTDVGDIPYETIDEINNIKKREDICDSPENNRDLNNTNIKEITSDKLNATDDIFKADKFDNNYELLNETTNNVNQSVLKVLNRNYIHENEYNEKTTENYKITNHINESVLTEPNGNVTNENAYNDNTTVNAKITNHVKESVPTVPKGNVINKNEYNEKINVNDMITNHVNESVLTLLTVPNSNVINEKTTVNAKITHHVKESVPTVPKGNVINENEYNEKIPVNDMITNHVNESVLTLLTVPNSNVINEKTAVNAKITNHVNESVLTVPNSYVINEKEYNENTTVNEKITHHVNESVPNGNVINKNEYNEKITANDKITNHVNDLVRTIRVPNGDDINENVYSEKDDIFKTNENINKHEGICDSPEILRDFNNTNIKEIPSYKLNAADNIFKTDEFHNNFQLLHETTYNVDKNVQTVPNSNDINENEYNEKTTVNDKITNNVNQSVLTVPNGNVNNEVDFNEKATATAQITHINNISVAYGNYQESPETLYFLDPVYKDQRPLFTPVIFNYTNMRRGTTDAKSKPGTLPSFNNPPPPCPCSKNDEAPSNIGPHEVPTQPDILRIKDNVLAMYNTFHTKAMHFLEHIKEATRASWARKMLCRTTRDLMTYSRCVRWVGDITELTTKSLLTALKAVKLDVVSLVEGRTRNISPQSVDPIHLIRILTAQKVSLEFALPDFLRQLHACARHCPSLTGGTLHDEYLESARLTDKDYVIRHYYTQQNYNEQIKQKYKI